MLKIDRQQFSLEPLSKPTLADVSISERYDLQEYISNSPDAFFEEISQSLFLIGKELEPSSTVADRIDLLAIDKDGCSVIVELKRGSNKLQMFQAITYAGMVSQWAPEDFVRNMTDEQQEAFDDFLDVDREDINRQQKIILVAEGYDYALLAGAEWLAVQHNVDIICCRIAIAKDAATNSEYLTCTNVYPAPELVDAAVRRGRRGTSTTTAKWADWDTALANLANINTVNYFRQQLESDRESRLPKRMLKYRIAGKLRWNVSAYIKNAYVWQKGRFPDDIEFWQNLLTLRTLQDEVKPVKRELCLRFYLNTAADFEAFHKVANERPQDIEWEDS